MQAQVVFACKFGQVPADVGLGSSLRGIDRSLGGFCTLCGPAETSEPARGTERGGSFGAFGRLRGAMTALKALPSRRRARTHDLLGIVAGHRHDQTLLTPLAVNDPKALVLPEISEAYRRNSFVWASRVRARNLREYLVVQTKHYLRIWLGDELFEALTHNWIKK